MALSALSGLTMSVLVSVTPFYGADPDLYQMQVWHGPTIEEAQDCAAMAKSLNESYKALEATGRAEWQGKSATCDLYPSDFAPAPTGDEKEEPTALASNGHDKFTF